MFYKRLPIRCRTVSLVICLLSMLAACSDSSSPSGQNNHLDAGDAHDTTSSDTNPDSNDAATDISSDGADAAGEDRDEMLVKLGSVLQDLEFVDDAHAVNFRRQRSPTQSFAPQTSISYLIDLSNPDDVRLADTLFAEDAQMQGTAVAGTVVTVTSSHKQTGELQVMARSFDVADGHFAQIDEIDVTPEGALSCNIYDVISREQQIVAACHEFLIELTIDPQGALTSVGAVDRTDEANEITTQPEYMFYANRQALTAGGYMLEVHDALSIWRLPSTAASPQAQDSSPLVTTLELPTDWIGDGWAFQPDTQMLYVCGEANAATGDKDAYVVDLTDPVAPQIADRWNVTDDWGHEALSCGASAVSQDRLFVGYRDFDRMGKTIWPFEIGSDPQTLAPLPAQSAYELPTPGVLVNSLAAHGGYLYYGYDAAPPTPPHMNIAAVPTSTFDAAADSP